jgi:hypothetical protein
LSKERLGPLQGGQRRFEFRANETGVTVGPNSTGMTPEVDEIAAIRSALQVKGLLRPGGLQIIQAADGSGRIRSYNLLTGEML